MLAPVPLQVLSLQPGDALQDSGIGSGFIVSNGQSLGVGFGQMPAVSTSQPFSNLMVADSSGTYDITKPNAPTLSLAPLVAPQRSNGGNLAAPYPQNIDGEEVDVSFANQWTAQLLANSQSAYPIVSSCVAVGGAQMTWINKTPGLLNSYAASIFEARVAARFAKGPIVPLCVILTHGETDADNFSPVATYQSQLVALQAAYQVDLNAIFGTNVVVPLVGKQQTSSPVSGSGPNNTALAFHAAAQADPSHIVLTGPGYQFTYAADDQHYAEYRGYGEKAAQIAHQIVALGKPWAPFWVTGASRVTNVVTLTCNVPVGPIVVDGTKTAPHQAGGLAAWAPGKGIEAFDAVQTVSACTGNGVSPIVLTVPSTANYTTNQTVLVTGALGNTNANGPYLCTVQDGTHLALQGTTGNGAWSAGGGGCQVANVIGISSLGISGNQLTVTLARSPTTGLVIGAAMNSDLAYGIRTGGFGSNCCTVLRDSDPFVGRSGTGPYQNFLCVFQMGVA